jgi:hypothetical protein
MFHDNITFTIVHLYNGFEKCEFQLHDNLLEICVCICSNFISGNLWRWFDVKDLKNLKSLYKSVFWPQWIMDWYKAQYIEFTKVHQVKQIVKSSNLPN